MKKNILVVPSLLALAVVATTPLLGMDNKINYKEKQPTSQGKNKKQRRFEEQKQQKKINRLEQELTKAKEQQLQLQTQQPKKIQNIQPQIIEDHEHYQIERNIDFEIFENPLYTPTPQSFDEWFAEITNETTQKNIPNKLVTSETEIINIALPERAAQNNETVAEKKVSKEKKQQQIDQSKNHFQSAMQELQTSRLFLQQQLNNTFEITENSLSNPETGSNPTQSETQVTHTAQPERATNNNTNDNQENPLMASVILPTQEKTLTLSEKFNYYTSTAHQILQQVMDDLETGAFDVRYKNSFDLLEEAITTATKNNDIQALAKIAALCQQKYAIWIRISDAVAQPASELLRTHYSTELTLANNTLEQKLKDRTKEWNLATVTCMSSIINTIATYQENMKKMQEDYSTTLEHENKRITDLRRDVSTFSCLNKTIRPATAELLTNNQLKTPKNDVHSSILSASERKLKDVMESVKIIQSIKGFQLKQEHAEELTQKCLTDK